MVEIKLPSVDGLPDNSEATIDLQLEQVQYLKKAYDQLAIEELIRVGLPDLIVLDFASHRIAEAAAKYGIPAAFLSVYTAATLAYLGPPEELKSGNQRTTAEQFTRPPDWFTFPSLVAHRPDFAPRMLRNLYFPDTSGVSSGQRLAGVVKGSQFVAVRSCREFEGDYMSLLEELYQKPVLPIGVLPPMVLQSKPFIWILRKPEGVESSRLLPPGFDTRTSNQGIVCLGWSPQMEILAHPAIGGCLFHSGWGSIIESLGFGHPLILMPMVADQGLNSKLLVEKGVGYEVPRREDGSFSKEAVATAIRVVMVAQEGEAIRLKAAQMQNVFGNHSLHDSYIDNFIHHLKKSKILKQ